MLSFISPIFAWLAAAAGGAVILIHLFRRRRPVGEMAFSNIRLLREILKSSLPRRRLRDLLLAALRALAATLILLFTAQPYLRGLFGGAASAQGERRVFWFIIDTSYSMGYRDATGASLLDRSRDAAFALADVIFAAIPAVKIGVASFAGVTAAETVLTPQRDPQTLRRALGGFKPNGISTNHAAWRDWIQGLDGKDQIAGIFVFSDLAGHGFTSEGASGADEHALRATRLPAPVVLINSGLAKTPNRRLGIALTEGSMGVDVAVSCYGRQGAGEIPLTVSDAVSGNTLATLRTRDCGRTQVSIKPLLGSDGRRERALLFAAPQDRLGFDDKQVLVVPPSLENSLLIIDGEAGRRQNESESYFVRQALSATRWNGKLTWMLQQEAEQWAERGRFPVEARQIWLCHPRQVSPRLLEILKAYSGGLGHALVITAGAGLDRPAVAALLGSEPAMPEPAGDGRLLPVPRQEDAPAWLGSLTLSEALSFNLSGVRVDRFQRLNPVAGLRALLEFKTGAGNIPLLSEKTIGESRIFFWATTIDPDWTNFPFKGFFVSFVRALAQENPEPHVSRNEPAGSIWSFVSDPGPGLGYHAVTPSGKKDSLTHSDGRWSLGPLSEIGLYGIELSHPVRGLSAPHGPGYLGVHLPKIHPESDLTPVARGRIRAVLGDPSLWTIVEGAEIIRRPNKALALLGSRDFGRPLLAGAIFFLSIEALAGWLFSRKESGN